MVQPLPKMQSNPLAAIQAFTQPRRNQLAGLASGLLSSPDFGQGLGLGFARAAEGRQVDDAYAVSQKEAAQRQEQLAKTISYLRTQPGGAQYAAAVENGYDPQQAFKDWFAESQGMAGPEPTANMREYEFAQQNPGFAEFLKGPVGGQDLPASVREYEYAKTQGYTGTFQEYESEMRKAGATNIDFNANQGTAAAYADRMKAANDVLDDPALEAAQTDVVQQGLSGIPIAGNFVTSEAKKLADQAQRDFINAILRRESGAVISPSEFENAKQQYFPQPGDTDAVKKQKRANRVNAINGVARAAGPSYVPPGGTGGNQTSTGVSWSIEP